MTIKRIFILLIVSAVMITAIEAGQRKHEKSITLSIVGAAAGNDSTVAETIAITNTPFYYNRVYGRVIFDDIVDTNGVATDFGKEDTIKASLYAVYADTWRLLDTKSAVYAGAAAAAAGTLTVFSDFNADTLFTEKLYLIIYVADTAATIVNDSTMIFPVRYEILHTFQ